MIAFLAALIPALAPVFSRFLRMRETVGTEEQRTQREVTLRGLDVMIEDRRTNASVIQTAMQYKVFWIPWLMATLPLSAWFGWGVLDTLTNGALPDVAELPPQLKAYADTVWRNVFYVGAVGVAATAAPAALQAAAGVLSRIRKQQ